jgi:hypothetical protein
MKTLFSLLLICVFTLHSVAQQSVLTLSEEFKVNNKGGMNHFIKKCSTFRRLFLYRYQFIGKCRC